MPFREDMLLAELGKNADLAGTRPLHVVHGAYASASSAISTGIARRFGHLDTAPTDAQCNAEHADLDGSISPWWNTLHRDQLFNPKGHRLHLLDL